MTLTAGYADTTSGVFTVTGTAPVAVAKVSGNDRITWNNATRRLAIAAGLPAGDYPVVLRASNTAGNSTFNFTLKVEEPRFYIDRPATLTGGALTIETGNANPFLAVAGDKVTLTVATDDGFELDGIHVYGMRGDRSRMPGVVIPLQERTLTGFGTLLGFEFTMPAHHVAIEVLFTDTRTVGNEQRITNNEQLNAWVQDGVLYIGGQTMNPNRVQGAYAIRPYEITYPVRVYTIAGTLVYRGIIGIDNTEVVLPGRGVYIVTDGIRVVKVTN
jgi:hypothetical protein